jgi:hypothetical protein
MSEQVDDFAVVRQELADYYSDWVEVEHPAAWEALSRIEARLADAEERADDEHGTRLEFERQAAEYFNRAARYEKALRELADALDYACVEDDDWVTGIVRAALADTPEEETP